MEESDLQKFSMGIQVVSKKTGLPLIGYVVGCMSPVLYQIIHQTKHSQHPWTKLYPEWTNKYIYYVQAEIPQKGVSFEEYKQANPYLNKEGLKKGYEDIKKSQFFTFPEDDLELFEQGNDEIIDKVIQQLS